jgi:hypothetical protein
MLVQQRFRRYEAGITYATSLRVPAGHTHACVCQLAIHICFKGRAVTWLCLPVYRGIANGGSVPAALCCYDCREPLVCRASASHDLQRTPSQTKSDTKITFYHDTHVLACFVHACVVHALAPILAIILKLPLHAWPAILCVDEYHLYILTGAS